MNEKGEKCIKILPEGKRPRGKRRHRRVDNDQIEREDIDWIKLARNKIY
jgi:hypothetical protein